MLAWGHGMTLGSVAAVRRPKSLPLLCNRLNDLCKEGHKKGWRQLQLDPLCNCCYLKLVCVSRYRCLTCMGKQELDHTWQLDKAIGAQEGDGTCLHRDGEKQQSGMTMWPWSYASRYCARGRKPNGLVVRKEEAGTLGLCRRNILGWPAIAW